MAQITAAMVKQLREMTDSPMMECKKALVEADGDMDAAVDVLRKNGLAAAAKKAGRDTNEGAVAAYISEDGTMGALALLACDMNGETVEAALTEMIHVIGENMKISRTAVRKPAAGGVASYIHMGGKIGVLVEFSFEKPETASAEAFKTFAHDVAMQVAATAPIAAVREDVAQDVIDHEVEIYKAQAAESGKPEAIQEKMAIGRLEKFFKGIVLNEQEFIKDSSMTIKAYAEKVSKELGDTVKVVAFDRLVCGE